MSNWQDMATAPKDGSDILIVASVDTETEYALAWWCLVRERWSNHGMTIHPTNFLGWMPLPAPPSPEPEGEAWPNAGETWQDSDGEVAVIEIQKRGNSVIYHRGGCREDIRINIVHWRERFEFVSPSPPVCGACEGDGMVAAPGYEILDKTKTPPRKTMVFPDPDLPCPECAGGGKA